MNAGADQAASTVRVTVVQASSVFYDTPATLGACNLLSLPVVLAVVTLAPMVFDSLSRPCGCLDWCCARGVRLFVSPKLSLLSCI
jgi:hypothetical protein